ncbi:30S ribosomal protein S15 [Vampirovibrio chlorellavorus]|uniref:30S ribosomal protein S15 n=1 Tax=Vampirovibrio chlorellavorus TaxID=758823 RepID=UPI0026EADC46|nr:30S ribosomal protein S15 [Vampirovibrio chlorellavorus]
MPLTSEQKKDIFKEHAVSANDTGSAPVQIAMLSKRISELTEHLKANRKDFACQRGLQIMVGRRRRYLNYFKKTSTPEAYKELITKLGIRK